MSSVVTYRDDGSRCFCQIQFDSGERVLISIAGKPTPSIKIMRCILAGTIPIKTIWECSPTTAGGDDAFVDTVLKMFQPDPLHPARPLQLIRDAVLQCSSIEEARTMLLQREA